MAILVTGAAGFIGHAVSAALLQRGEHVVGIDNMNSYYPVPLKEARLRELQGFSRFSPCRIDFADEAALQKACTAQGIDQIVHLGAQPGVRYSLENPSAYVRSNIAGHVNVLELARALGVKHMVYASSSSVYGGNSRLPFSVSDPVGHPLSLYAATKRSDELMSESYAHLFRIPLTGLRFFTVYGPWGRPDMAVWRFTEAIFGGNPVHLYGGGTLRRDFTHVDDIVRGVLAALGHVPADDGAEKPGGSRSPHAIYNLGNHRPEIVTDLVTAIEAAVGKRADCMRLPMQPGDATATFADIELTSRDLDWKPEIDLVEGIPHFVQWYRDWVESGRIPRA